MHAPRTDKMSLKKPSTSKSNDTTTSSDSDDVRDTIFSHSHSHTLCSDTFH